MRAAHKKTGLGRFFYARRRGANFAPTNPGRKKTGPKTGFFRRLITSKQLEQRLQEQQRPKRQERQRLEQQRQLELELVQEQQERLLERPLELGSQWFLLFSSKQPEQRWPAGKRSAGIFSWVFLN